MKCLSFLIESAVCFFILMLGLLFDEETFWWKETDETAWLMVWSQGFDRKHGAC